MDLIRKAALLLAAGIIAASCGNSEDESYDVMETRSFERWISRYVNTDPAAPVAKPLTNGGYMELLYEDNQLEQYPGWGDYVRINYRGMLLSDWDFELERGSVFVNRSEDEARRLGTYTTYTNYVPQLILNSYTNYLMPGMQQALQRMKVGDVVRLYLPSTQASITDGLTVAGGYQGIVSTPSGVPIIVEMELAGIVENPQTLEERFVIEYAETEWDQTVADTVRQYIFLDVDKSTKTEYKAGVDSTVTLYYKAMLPMSDDFIISTNIDSVGQRLNRAIQSYTSYKPANWADASDAAMARQAFYEVFESGEITYGCDFEFITTSQFAYGASGQTPATGTTEVLPYQPVKYWVRLEEYETDDDEDE